MELAWWQKEVIYQIFFRSFQDSNGDGIGDINGIISRLDYLIELGVGAICLSPFYTTDFHDSGYDITNFKNIDSKLGSLQDFDALIQEAHRLGLKIIIDLPVDFTSINHPWFKESCSSKDNDKSNYYLWSDKIPNNWLSKFGGKTWSYNKEREQYYMHSFSSLEPDLNWRSDTVVDEFCQIIRFWLDREVDGINFNAINLIVKDKNLRDNPRYPSLFGTYFSQRHIFDRNRPFSHNRVKLLRSVLDDYEGKILLGEVVVEPPGEPELAASYYGNYKDELHLVFDYTFINTSFKPKTWVDAAKRWYNATDTSWPSWVISNQFKNRLMTRFSGNIQRSRLSAMFLLTQRGTPFIYYGEELGLENSNINRNQAIDIPFRKNFFFKKGRDGARGPMVWTTGKNAGFSTNTPYLPQGNKNKCSVEVQKNKEVSMYNYYRKFIALRKKHEALLSGDIVILDVHDENIICYLRTEEKEALLVLLNFSRHKRQIKLSDIGLPLVTEKTVFSTNPLAKDPFFDRNIIFLNGYEGAIYSLSL